MVNTRKNYGEGSQHGAENNPPPPPQTLAEVVAQQTQILQMLVQNQVQQQTQPHGRQGQQQLATYSDFAGTHPPIFSKVEDPLEADSWLRLMEGTRTVREYVQKFNELSRYAPGHVDTDEKRTDCFLEGMTPKLRSRLGRRFDNFNQLVDDAIAMEEDLRLHHIEKRKAKATVGSSGSAPQRPRMTYQAPPRPASQPQRQQQIIVRPAQQQYP